MGLAKEIPSISIHDQLKKDPKFPNGVTYAILERDNNYHTPEEMAEIYHAVNGNDNSKFVTPLVAFKPERILQQEILIGLSLKVQISNLEEDLSKKFAEATTSILANDFITKANAVREKTLADLTKINDDPEYMRESEERQILANTKLSDKYVRGTYSNFGTEQDIRLIIAADKINNDKFRKMAQQEVTAFIEGKFSAQSSEKEQSSSEFLPLTVRESNERYTMAINGGIASGKGSSYATLVHHYNTEIGRHMKDTVKINGDSYKSILNARYQTNSLPKEKMYFSQLVQDEASLVGSEIASRLFNELKKGRGGPDVFIDKVELTPDLYNAATLDGANLIGIMVSTPVEQAIARSYSRGEAIGRFEHTKNILTTHQRAPDAFLKMITEKKDSSMTYQVLDNQNSADNRPKKIAEFNCSTKKIMIDDPKLFIDFLRKKSINPELKFGEVTYTSPDNNLLISNFKHNMKSEGFDVESISREILTEGSKIRNDTKTTTSDISNSTNITPRISHSNSLTK